MHLVDDKSNFRFSLNTCNEILHLQAISFIKKQIFFHHIIQISSWNRLRSAWTNALKFTKKKLHKNHKISLFNIKIMRITTKCFLFGYYIVAFGHLLLFARPISNHYYCCLMLAFWFCHRFYRLRYFHLCVYFLTSQIVFRHCE